MSYCRDSGSSLFYSINFIMTSESDKQYLEAIKDIEDEARPPIDRSAVRPNLDGDDAWLFESQGH